MTTASDIVRLALRDAGLIGLGQTPRAELMNEGLQRMNAMIAQWAAKRWLVYRTVDISCISTGAQTYTVGLNQQFDLPVRPDRLESAYIRQFPANPIWVPPNPTIIAPTGSPFVYTAEVDGTYSFNAGGGPAPQRYVSRAAGDPSWTSFFPATSIHLDAGDSVQLVYTVAPSLIQFVADHQVQQPQPVPGNAVDYPLILVQSREDWSRFSMKGIGNFGYCAWYDPSWPVGTLYIYPVPEVTIFEIHCIFKFPLSGFANLAEEIQMPDQYVAALHYNLGIRMRAAYQLDPDPQQVGFAKDSLEVIRGQNLAIGNLRMPTVLQRRGHYNVFSDDYS